MYNFPVENDPVDYIYQELVIQSHGHENRQLYVVNVYDPIQNVKIMNVPEIIKNFSF